jgi:hypothetical protein
VTVSDSFSEGPTVTEAGDFCERIQPVEGKRNLSKPAGEIHRFSPQ